MSDPSEKRPLLERVGIASSPEDLVRKELEALPLHEWNRYCETHGLVMKVKMDFGKMFTTSVQKEGKELFHVERKHDELPQCLREFTDVWFRRAAECFSPWEAPLVQDIARALVSTAEIHKQEVNYNWSRLEDLSLFCIRERKTGAPFVRDREFFLAWEKHLVAVQHGKQKISIVDCDQYLEKKLGRGQSVYEHAAEIYLRRLRPSEIDSMHPLGQIARLHRLISSVPVPEILGDSELIMMDPSSQELWFEERLVAHVTRFILYTFMGVDGITLDELLNAFKTKDGLPTLATSSLLRSVQAGLKEDITNLGMRIHRGLDVLAKEVGYAVPSTPIQGQSGPYRG